jgi:hypothetical protein
MYSWYAYLVHLIVSLYYKPSWPYNEGHPLIRVGGVSLNPTFLHQKTKLQGTNTTTNGEQQRRTTYTEEHQQGKPHYYHRRLNLHDKEHQERNHIIDRPTTRRQRRRREKDMQDDASKEGNEAIANNIRLPTKVQTKLSLGKTNGRRLRQCLQRGEICLGDASIVGPMKWNRAMLSPVW